MAVRGREKFSKIKPILNCAATLYSIFPFRVRKMLFEHYRNTKGLKGIAIRYILLKTIAKKVGDNVSIHPGCYIFFPENLELGDNVSIHPMCYIDAVGGVTIGNDVSIAHAVTIMSSSHRFDMRDIPIKDQPFIVEKTVVSDNVWIGAKVTVLCGKTIGSGSVVGASSVITKDVTPHTIVAGVPAKVIKNIE